jgi:hypothetical protein
MYPTTSLPSFCDNASLRGPLCAAISFMPLDGVHTNACNSSSRGRRAEICGSSDLQAPYDRAIVAVKSSSASSAIVSILATAG